MELKQKIATEQPIAMARQQFDRLKDVDQVLPKPSMTRLSGSCVRLYVRRFAVLMLPMRVRQALVRWGDPPLAVLKIAALFNYFKQLFAQ
jgi:hypothetical protein